MNLTKTLMSCALALAVSAGCGKNDANAAPTEKPTEAPAAATAKGDSWSAEAKVTHDAKKNVWTLEIFMRAADGYHVNTEYPYRFAPPAKEEDRTVNFDGITKDKKDFVKDDTKLFQLENCKPNDKGVQECSQLHFTATFKPKEGVAVEKANAEGVLKFGVCSADKCKMDKAKLSVALKQAKSA